MSLYIYASMNKVFVVQDCKLKKIHKVTFYKIHAWITGITIGSREGLQNKEEYDAFSCKFLTRSWK